MAGLDHPSKLRWPDTDHATYVALNDIVQNGRRRPFEVFINSKNMEHYAWTVALTRMISAVFRRGGFWMEGKYVPSLLAAIGEVIERHMVNIGFLPAPAERQAEAARRVANLPEPGETAPRLPQCPKCGQAAIIRQEGCDLCTACGYSKCV